MDGCFTMKPAPPKKAPTPSKKPRPLGLLGLLVLLRFAAATAKA
jgi:hypothetical protein